MRRAKSIEELLPWLYLKGISTEYLAVHLGKNAHLSDDFKAVNPQQLVPALVLGLGTMAFLTRLMRTSMLEVRGAATHNLRDVDVDLPLGVLVVLTGVAGSGKSSLVQGSIAGREGVVVVDQTGIRGSRRSNPATYTGALDPIRKAFAKANGVKPALFSANSEGACPTCNGAGVVYLGLGIVAGVLLLLLGGPSAVAWAVLSVVIGLAVALVALATYSVAALLRALTSLYMLIEDDWTARMRGAGDFGGGDGVADEQERRSARAQLLGDGADGGGGDVVDAGAVGNEPLDAERATRRVGEADAGEDPDTAVVDRHRPALAVARQSEFFACLSRWPRKA